MAVITIICPTKFKEEINDVYEDLSLAGNIVLMPVCVDEYTKKTEEEKLMKLHKAKIDLADEIVVIRKAGYLGRGSYEEIGYAYTTGKDIRFIDFR
jgi:hypothetical protein